MSSVTFDRVWKRFDDIAAVEDFSLEILDGEFLVLLGPSGCGKSTALRMIAGLETVSDGSLSIGNTVVNDVAPKDRDIAMVFQSYALYPHMSVRKNIESPLVASKARRLPDVERDARVADAATTLGLTDYLDRKPGELSGGQRQRVALARAIVRNPEVFLMDEPLSNLDAKLRTQTRAELVALHRRLGTTFIYVTHDQTEAMTMADRIAIIRDGKLQQVGRPQAVYEHPANLFVAEFIGTPPMNTFPGEAGEGGTLDTPFGRLVLDAAPPASGAVMVGVRPEHLVADPDGPFLAHLDGTEELGHERLLLCSAGDTRLIARQSADLPAPTVGDQLGLAPLPTHVHLFDAGTGVALANTDPVGSERKRRRLMKRKWTEALTGYAMVAPILIGFAVFAFYPAYRVVHLAFYQPSQNQFIGGADQWIGLDAFRRAFGSGGEFWPALWVSVKFALMTVPAGVLCGLLLAQVADRKLRGIRIFQTIFSSTVASSVAVASVVFLTLLQPESGILRNVEWLSLTRPDSAIRAIALSSIWQNAGLTFVIVLAALQTVPGEVIEAATLDGYSSLKRFWKVTVPLISPALVFLAIVLVANALQAYAQFEILTPVRKAQPLLYKVADPEGTTDLSTRAVYAIGLFFVTFAVSAAQFVILDRRAHYGD